MAEDGKKVECIDGPERLKKAVEELKKAALCPAMTQSFEQMEKNRILEEFHASSRVLGKIEDIQMNPDGINFKCRCVMNKKNLPSPGFIFANKDAIKFNTRVNYNIENDTVEYIFHDSRLKICKAVHRTYIMDDETAKAFEDNIILELAREYDNIMIRKVLNMDSNRLNRFVTMLDAVGGGFRIDQSVGERATAHIDIPCDMLSHLHIDGDGSTDIFRNFATPKIPAIRNIQTFNDRAVQITFADGSQTKCVCGKDEEFDLYEGVAFCMFKKFLGKDGHKHFNDLMRYAFKKLDEQEESKRREAEIKAEKKRHEEKKKRQAQRRKAKKREEKIGIFYEALKRNRQDVVDSMMPVYSVPEPAFKPDENPEKEG